MVFERKTYCNANAIYKVFLFQMGNGFYLWQIIKSQS